MDLKKSSSEREVVTVDVHQAKNLLDKGYKYLDVRTEEEFKNGHVMNALNIPYMFNTPEGREKNVKFLDQVEALFNKHDHLIVGCRSGVRSLHAAAHLVDSEFKNVCNMGGGQLAWLACGFPVIKFMWSFKLYQ